MIQIKRLPITFVVLIALVGIISCVAIEPAFAISENHVAAETEEGHCDFICHDSHHLWNVGSSDIILKQPLKSLGEIILAFTQKVDPPLQSIFHPPLALA